MCFRPTSAAKQIICPKCQTANPPALGKCKSCGETLPRPASPFSIPSGPPGPSGFNLDSNVGALLDNPASRAVIDKHIPSLPKHPQLAMARTMSLKVAAANSGGECTNEMLIAVSADLQKI